MTSMTGYAYCEETTETAVVSVEIKSWNSRFLDLNVNIPGYLGRLDKRIREAVCTKVLRGKVDVNIRIKEEKQAAAVSCDSELARSYAAAITEAARAVGLGEEPIPLSLIISQEGVLTVDRDTDPERYWGMIEPVFCKALDEFCGDRLREGENLCRDLLGALDTLDSAAWFFKEWQPKMEDVFKKQLTARFDEICGEASDPQRIMQEVAAMLVKYTINEEIVRLHSHLSAMRSEITDNPAPGRKIDFLCQEINREINTIGSKNQFVEVGRMVIEAKNAIENIREQARNIE